MKAAVCKKPFEISIEEVKPPVPQADELLIQVKASAICGSDLKGYQGKHPLMHFPLVMGHEFSGIIVEKGSGVKNFRIGDRVVVEPSFPCGHCFFCQRMEYRLCEDLKQLGHQLPGAFAEYTVSKAKFTYPLPEGISFEKAALIQPLAISIHGVDRTGMKKGQFVVILGMGAIGLLLLQLSLKRGANVLVTDVIDFKLDMAKALGAQKVLVGSDPQLIEKVKDWTNGRGADIAIESAGSSKTVQQAFSIIRKGGTVVFLGITGKEKDEVNLEKVVIDELNLLGTVRYAAGDFLRAIEMIQQENVDLDALILKRFPLIELPKVLEEAVRFPEKMLRYVMVA